MTSYFQLCGNEMGGCKVHVTVFRQFKDLKARVQGVKKGGCLSHGEVDTLSVRFKYTTKPGPTPSTRDRLHTKHPDRT